MSDSERGPREAADREGSRLVARAEQALRALDARQQHELLGRLGLGIAHELNNLLGVISNSMHVLQRIAGDPAAQAPIEASFRSIDSATRLTQQMLQLAGGPDFATPVIDLGATLAEMQALMRTALGKRIRLKQRIAPGTRAPMVDTHAFRLVVLHLLLNARAAMPDGGQMWIDAHDAAADSAESSDGAQVDITFSDDGIGMDDAALGRAFDPFFTRCGEGSAGLGLTRVRELCEAAGGSVRLDSTVGLGTAVTLRLPARPARSGAMEAGMGVAEQWTLPQPVVVVADSDAVEPGSRGRLLLVEDVDELGEVTQALLENCGFRVQRASNAEQALQMVESDPPFDIVLSDIVMPGRLDGVDLANALRERRPGLPVVLISGYSTALARSRDFALLRKPCPPGSLVATLQQALRAAAGARSERE